MHEVERSALDDRERARAFAPRVSELARCPSRDAREAPRKNDVTQSIVS